MKKFVKLDRTEALFTAYALQEYMRNYDESSELREFLDSLLFKIESCLLGMKTIKEHFASDSDKDVDTQTIENVTECDNMSTTCDESHKTCCSCARAHSMFPVFMQFSNVSCFSSQTAELLSRRLTLTFRKNESTHHVELYVHDSLSNTKLHTFYDVCEVKYDASAATLVVFEALTFPSMHIFVLSNESDKSFCEMLLTKNNGTIYKKDVE